ncbi:MAG: Fur family transcriptional regulator [Stomatobaculum sp.]
MKIRKHSRQREAILANLMMRRDHPTADALYQSLRADFPNISLGTVYRNLSLLAEAGKIRKLHCGEGVEHYDYDTTDHAHLVCSCCGSVTDLPLSESAALNHLAELSGAGAVERHTLIFYGRCRQCMKAPAASSEA